MVLLKLVAIFVVVLVVLLMSTTGTVSYDIISLTQVFFGMPIHLTYIAICTFFASPVCLCCECPTDLSG